MTFHSILSEKTEDGIQRETLEAPVFFVDLNLDQIMDAITAGKQEYNLKPFFYTSLHDVDAIKYRHEIFRDLENKNLFENIKSFAKKCVQCATILPKRTSFTTNTRRKDGFWTRWQFMATPLIAWFMIYPL